MTCLLYFSLIYHRALPPRCFRTSLTIVQKLVQYDFWGCGGRNEGALLVSSVRFLRTIQLDSFLLSRLEALEFHSCLVSIDNRTLHGFCKTSYTTPTIIHHNIKFRIPRTRHSGIPTTLQITTLILGTD